VVERLVDVNRSPFTELGSTQHEQKTAHSLRVRRR